MADEHVFRSIALILQNHTDGEFLVDGHATIHGEWETEPKSGDVIGSQSTASGKSFPVQGSKGHQDLFI